MIDKFRAWDKKRNEWYGAGNPNILTFKGFAIFGECTLLCTPRCEDLQHLEITQHTGLKDKNGVEIYDGDVLAFDSRAWYGGMYNSGIADYVFKVEQSETGEWVGAGICTEWSTHCEVIGNIYENGDLLK